MALFSTFSSPVKTCQTSRRSVTLGPDKSEMVTFWPKKCHFRPKSGVFDWKWSSKCLLSVRVTGQNRSKVLKSGHFGHFWHFWAPVSFEHSPRRSVTLGADKSIFWSKVANFGPKWPLFGQNWPLLGQKVLFLATFGHPAKTFKKTRFLVGFSPKMTVFDGNKTVIFSKKSLFLALLATFWSFLSYRARGCLLCR